MAADALPDDHLTLDAIRAALRLPHFDTRAARAPMEPETRRLHPPAATPPRQAAVLLLLWPWQQALHFVLTRRARQLRGHSGQVSLPGGRCDPEDVDHAATALRETREELGIPEGAVQLLGQLDELYIPPSNFLVRPQVGALAEAPRFRPRAAEVAAVLTVPLAQLFDAQRKRASLRHSEGRALHIPCYELAQHQVWGATAMMLSEFEWRLRVVSSEAARARPTPF